VNDKLDRTGKDSVSQVPIILTVLIEGLSWTINLRGLGRVRCHKARLF